MMIDNLPYRQVGAEAARSGGLLCVVDHASNHVPEGIELGIDPRLLDEHIAIDIGVEGIADRLARLIIGSVIGLAVGIPFGLLLGINRTVADMFYPIMNFFQSVSGIAIFPIVVIWWGNSEKTILVVILYTSFFPIAYSVLSGVREIPIRYIQAVRTLGASRYQVIRDVLLPGAMPSIATGSRLSIGFAWRAVIAGEMLAGREGLGEAAKRRVGAAGWGTG